MLNIDDLRGVWRRILLQRPGVEADRSSRVYWLQGDRFFADLRQPAGRPEFSGIRCLRQLQGPQIAWLALQEGFAGTFHLSDDVAEWHRAVDFQPATGIADRGRLRLEGDVLEERGTEAPYVEQWQREGIARAPAFGLRLERDFGQTAYLLRTGDAFFYVRPRRSLLPSGRDLSALVAEMPDLESRQDLLDFEISFGRTQAGCWRIRHSSLPFKEGQAFRCAFSGTSSLILDDIGPDGRPVRSRWSIAESDAPVGEDELAQLLHMGSGEIS